MLPGNASDVVDRLSEKAQRSKSSGRVEEAVPDLGLFYKFVVHWSF